MFFNYYSLVSVTNSLRPYAEALAAKAEAAAVAASVDVGPVDAATLASFAETAGKPIECQAAVAWAPTRAEWPPSARACFSRTLTWHGGGTSC